MVDVGLGFLEDLRTRRILMTTTYVLAQLKVENRSRYEGYAAQFMSVLANFDARLLAYDDAPVVIRGPWAYEKVVLIAFRDHEEATRWMAAPEYRKIAVEREASTTETILSFRGLHPWRESSK
jgi:uncharacterized protein (DUF1330 family)